MDGENAVPPITIGEQPPTYFAAHTSVGEGKGVAEVDRTTRQVQQRSEVVEVTRAISTVRVRDENSESDDGGIQMVDNDDDGDLMHVPSEPIPDDDEGLMHVAAEPLADDEKVQGSSSRTTARREVVEDQKFFGSFPKGKKKVTASEMGLY
jgi:hypothetical protein